MVTEGETREGGRSRHCQRQVGFRAQGKGSWSSSPGPQACAPPASSPHALCLWAQQGDWFCQQDVSRGAPAKGCTFLLLLASASVREHAPASPLDEERPTDVWGRTFRAEGGNSRCKGPKAGAGLVCLSKSKGPAWLQPSEGGSSLREEPGAATEGFVDHRKTWASPLSAMRS